MFDFFFKRARSRTAANAVGVTTPSTVAGAPNPSAPDRRQLALDQAAALGVDEVAALTFVLSSSVPEARLRAAQLLHGQQAMEQALKAMRDTDRRVAKLMQQRLAALDQQERAGQRMQDAIGRAQALQDEPKLTPNQVIELDRAWTAIGAGESPQASEFERLRTQLAQRLQAQAALQRCLMDLSASIRSAIDQGDALTPEQADAVLGRVDAGVATVEADRERSSLPRQLMPEVQAARLRLQALHAGLQTRAAAVAAREQALAGWQALLAMDAAAVMTSRVGDGVDAGETADTGVAVESIKVVEAVPAVPAVEAVEAVEAVVAVEAIHGAAARVVATNPAPLPSAESLRQQWRALPPVHDPELAARLQARFETILTELAPPAPLLPQKKPHPVRLPIVKAGIPSADSRAGSVDADEMRMLRASALEQLRAALDEGALQRATEQDRQLRALDTGPGSLTSQQQAALNTARGELMRLQGWAKWGGTVSREELVVAVESLPQRELGVAELGKKVGSMRERWRALDASAGPPPRPLWLRFDAACTAAYAPVAAHFAMLAQERETNVAKARGLLAEVAGQAASAGVGGAGEVDGVDIVSVTPDWRAIAFFCQRMEQAWQRLGPLDRKQQKQLNAAFEQAMQPLRAPLAQQQEQEIALREKLIAEVELLNPQARDTPEQLQTLQAQWQQHAKAFPLARAQEQELWQRFRGACDQFFAQRKDAVASADSERNASLAAKTALCLALEQLAANPTATDAARATLLREHRQAWTTIGPVPRSAQAGLQARVDAALVLLQSQRDATRRDAAQLHAVSFDTALAACLASEQRLLQFAEDAPTQAPAAWEPTLNLPAPLEQVLHARFAAAEDALAQCDTGLREHLLQNQPTRDATLLQMEISLGLDSPQGFTRERLQLQVAGLQSTFRSGTASAAADTPLMQLTRLCALTAVADAVAQDRMKAIARAVLNHD